MYFWQLIVHICFSFRRYGRLILKKYDVFNSIQFILIVFWGKVWLCLPPGVTWHEYLIVIHSEFYALLPVVAVVFGGQSSQTTTMLRDCGMAKSSERIKWQDSNTPTMTPYKAFSGALLL